MSFNYWFLYNITSGAINQTYLGNADQWTNIGSQGVIGPFPQSTASAAVQDAFANPSKYLVQNGQLVVQSYITVTAAQSTTPNGQYTITATLNNPPATPPTSCTYTVGGQTYTAAISANKASLTVNVHPSIANQSITVTASATGCVSGTVSIGGSRTDVGLQAFIPTGSTIPTIAPTGTGSKIFLQSYYALSPATLYRLIADIGTAVNVLTDAVFNIIIPALQKTTWSPVALDANQTSAINDIKTNLLPYLYTTLENAYPSGGAKQLQFADYEVDLSKSYAAFQSYVTDLQAIPNLV